METVDDCRSGGALESPGVMFPIRRTPLVVVALACALTAMSASLALAAPGDLDATFGGDGKVTTNFSKGFDGAAGVVLQADGKIVAAGEAGGKGGRFALARYNSNGRLDKTFSSNGKVKTNFTSWKDRAGTVAIQANGKIVAAGRAGGKGGRFALVRYHADGTLDTAFGGDGKVSTNFTAGNDEVKGVAVQANGKIVAAGSAFSNCSCSKFALARYNADGSLDTAFGGDGKVTTRFKVSFGGHANGVAIQADGKIVAAGSAGDIFGPFAVARYNVDGTLDTTFSKNGKVTTRMGKGEEEGKGVAIQANGKIVVAGYTDGPHQFGDTFGPGRFALARYRVNGTLDPRFSGNGKVKTRFGAQSAAANGVAIQAGGKIVAAGGAGGKGGKFAVARYNLNGRLDKTFSGNGKVKTNFTAGEDGAVGVAIQSDQKIVAAGHAVSLGRGGKFALSRYLDG
ncbi:MAG: hypothetical protein M3P18_14270 [Actinomycetota bacterium]|nr:hypothetical protein [Actinomycetota bacterium]